MGNSDEDQQGKKCECGHFKNEHLFVKKRVSKIAFLGEGFFRVPQEARGLCRYCSCPKYLPPRRLRSRREIEYTPVPKNFDIDSEKRCSRCGRLLSNHKDDVGHPFQNLFSN